MAIQINNHISAKTHARVSQLLYDSGLDAAAEWINIRADGLVRHSGLEFTGKWINFLADGSVELDGLFTLEDLETIIKALTIIKADETNSE